MNIVKCIKKDKNINIVLFNKISFLKKEKYKSSSFYYFFSIPIFKIRFLVNEKKVFCLNILIYKKYIKQTDIITEYVKGSDYIYISYHTGEFYYLCNLIKNDFDKYKHIKIVSCFKYLEQIFELFDFPKEWINDNFLYINEFIPSCLYFANKNGEIINLIETDYEKGLLFNKKLSHKHVSHLIGNLLGKNEFKFSEIEIKKFHYKQKTALIFPESIFNGNLNLEFLTLLIFKLLNLGYKILINSNKDTWDELLNKNVKRIFLSYKDTYALASNCELIIGVRSGFFDCIQGLATNNTSIHIIYNDYCYPCYNHMHKFKDFCLSTYGLSTSPFSSNIYEYKWLENNEISYQNFINQILNNIKRGKNA